MKEFKAADNKSFTTNEIERLIAEGFNNIATADLRKLMMNTKKIIDTAWCKKGIVEDATEQLVTNLNS